MLPLEAAIGVDNQLASINYTALNKQFINGQWVDGHEDAIVDNLNPFTDDIIHTLRSAGTADVDAAFEAAKQASPAWAATNPLVRRIFSCERLRF
ncbi:aldehyde dehydrogenase family protein [Spirosoma telluris]|uniref:aldehyde dehydrogenase family protein n=1 Tax=Spirosoma telluris TaxID=2183553 RepID=UPI0018DDE068